MSVMPIKVIDKPDFSLDDATVIMSDNHEQPLQDIGSIMKEVVAFFKEQASVTIKIPSQGTSLCVNNDQTEFYFSSKAEERGARIAMVDRSSEEVVLDEKVSNASISTIALSRDNQFIYFAGETPIIKKLLVSDLLEKDEFKGHHDAITKIIISNNDSWLFSSSEDGTVRLWTIGNSAQRDNILQNGRARALTIDLSANNSYLCSGNDDGYVKVFTIDYISKTAQQIGSINVESAVWSVKISNGCNFIVTGDQQGKVKLYKFNSWEYMHEFSHSLCIRDIDISAAEDVIVTASDDATVKIWDVYRNQNEITFNKHTESVKRVILLKYGKVVTISDDKTLVVWMLPSFESRKFLETEKIENINHIWYSNASNQLQALCKMPSEYWIATWEKAGGFKELVKIHQNHPVFCEPLESLQEIVVAGRAGMQDIKEFNGEQFQNYTCIGIYNASQQRRIRGHLLDTDIQSLAISPKGDFCCIGQLFKVSVYDYATFTLKEHLFAHGTIISQMLINPKETILITCGRESIKKFKIGKSAAESMFIQDQVKPFDNTEYILEISDDGQYLYLLTDSTFEIINLYNFIVIVSIPKKYNGILKNLHNTLLLYNESTVDIYSAESFQFLANIENDFIIKTVVISSNKKYIYYYTNEGLMKLYNPLSGNKIKLVGSDAYLNKFKDHIEKLLRNDCDSPYLESHWLIEPVHINLLHIYSYLNQGDLIRDAMVVDDSKTSVAFISSQSKFSPVSISISMGYNECTHSIITSIRKIINEDTSKTTTKKLLFQVLEDNILDLNIIGYKALHKLYRDILVYDDSQYLPNFCPSNVKLPVLITSNHLFPSSEEFNLSEDTSEYANAVKFRKTLVRLYIGLGSERSLEFMKSIEECTNLSIYQTPIIQIILQNKWETVRWYMWAQALAYVIYLALLCVYNVYEPLRTKGFLIAPFAVSGILYIYELIFVFISGFSYFNDFWNVIDSFRAWMMIAYSVLIWLSFFDISTTTNTDERYMFSALLLISWLRGITYFRVSSSTRYLIKLLFQVFEDIVAFLCILFYSIVAFALMFRAFDSNLNDDFFPFLTQSYMIIMGNWDNPTDPDFYSLILLFATMLNPIISLNLLIAILSDTFESVQENEVIADAEELAGMIIEIETLMFWNRQKNEKQFVQIMEDEILNQNEDDNLEELMLNIKGKIDYLNYDFKTHDVMLDKLRTEFQDKDQVLDRALSMLKGYVG